MKLQQHITPVLAALFVLAACQSEESSCPADHVCIPVDHAAAGSAEAGSGTAGSGTAGSGTAGTTAGSGTAGTTAGSGTAGTSVLTDAQVDAEIDAGQDAGPCGMPCPTALPQCHAASGMCVECLISDDCDGDDVCSSDHQCVSCNVDTDCKDPAFSRCNAAHECVGCSQDTQCERFPDTTECDEIDGICKFCTGDTEMEHCGTKACKRSTGTCTTTNRGSVATCNPCEADSECGAAMRCVTQTFLNQEVGSFCLYDQSLQACANASAAARPYSRPSENSQPSVDGHLAIYCFPVTTCPAVLDAIDWNGTSGGARSCTVSSECGIAQVDDGVCGPTEATEGRCTYLGCRGPQDCPTSGFKNCTGSAEADGYCVP